MTCQKLKSFKKKRPLRNSVHIYLWQKYWVVSLKARICTLLCPKLAAIYNVIWKEGKKRSNTLRRHRFLLYSLKFVWDFALCIYSNLFTEILSLQIFCSSKRARRLSIRSAILELWSYCLQWQIWQKHNVELYMEQALKYWGINPTIWAVTFGLWDVCCMKFVSWSVRLMAPRIRK